MTKQITITIDEHHQEAGKKLSKALLGRENLSGYIGYLIEQDIRKNKVKSESK